MTNSFDKLLRLPSWIILIGVLQVECATVYLPTWSSSMQYLRIYINTAYISISLMFLGNTFLGYLVEFIYHQIYYQCMVQSRKFSCTYPNYLFSWLRYRNGTRCFLILFWCFKLWNFISSIQFTCIKCGIRKCKIDVCMYS